MPTLKSEQQLAQAAAKKAERERDAAQAMRDYEAEKRIAHANMLRLRAQREARESAGAQTGRTTPASAKSAAPKLAAKSATKPAAAKPANKKKPAPRSEAAE